MYISCDICFPLAINVPPWFALSLQVGVHEVRYKCVTFHFVPSVVSDKSSYVSLNSINKFVYLLKLM